MKTSDFGRCAFGISLAMAMLAGCGGTQNAATALPQNAAKSAQSAKVHRPSSYPGDLLYVAGNGVLIFTLPQGQFFGTIQNGQAVNACSDSSGHVWVTTYNGYADEYNRDGSGPIAQIYMGYPSFIASCSVDPTTGDVALIVAVSNGRVIVFPPGSSKGTTYSTPFAPEAIGYDNKGNLFVVGDLPLRVAVLPKGGSGSFMSLSFNKGGNYSAHVQWDGAYMALSTYYPGLKVYRFKVLGSQAKVVQTISFARQDGLNFWIQGGTFVASTLKRPRGRRYRVALWQYPQGGKPFVILPIESGAYTISASPSQSRIRK